MHKPTNSELSVLNILWKEGSSTVREVNEILNSKRKVGYTNTLKIMQLMYEKGLLTRDTSKRSHRYSATIRQEDVKKNVVTDMVNTVFEGKTGKLLIHALGSYTPTKEEMEEIRTILNDYDDDASISKSD